MYMHIHMHMHMHMHRWKRTGSTDVTLSMRRRLLVCSLTGEACLTGSLSTWDDMCASRRPLNLDKRGSTSCEYSQKNKVMQSEEDSRT